MENNLNGEIPSGFSLLPEDNSFNDALKPLYIALENDGPRFGLHVTKKHLNPMAICHGAVYMALFDFAHSGIICHHLGKYCGTPTININIDYLAASKEGEWIYSDVKCLKLSNTMGFSQGIIRSDTEIKASSTGVFKLPKDLDAAPGITVQELLAMRAKS